jgi:quercetin dioxygenase-like cupin family protein
MARTGEAVRAGALLDFASQRFPVTFRQGEIMKTTRLTTTLFGSLASALLLAYFATSAAVAQTRPHVMENLSTAKWSAAPPMLPPGAEIAVLAGDPTKAAPYTVRLKFPANWDLPAHSHPTDEHVAVVSGEFFAGMGDRLDKKAAIGLRVGGFALMPAHANHFAYTKAETTILLYGQGPVDFKYVNPADDPRTRTSTNRH